MTQITDRLNQDSVDSSHIKFNNLFENKYIWSGAVLFSLLVSSYVFDFFSPKLDPKLRYLDRVDCLKGLTNKQWNQITVQYTQGH